MKKITKLLLLALTVALLVGTVFTTLIFAADTNDVNNLDPYAGKYQETTLSDGSIVTRYGTIPSASVANAEVVVFAQDKSIGGTTTTKHNAINTWALTFGNGGWANQNMDASYYENPTFVYVRQNITMSSTPSSFNMGVFRGTRVFDLNGYTMTTSGSLLFDNQIKTNSKVTSGEATWIFINGTINLNGKPLMRVNYSTGTFTKGTYIFEGITFNNVDRLIDENSSANNTSELKFIFKNCTFNVTASSSLYAAISNNYNASVEFVGGCFNYANGLDNFKTFVSDANNQTALAFSKNAEGQYTCINMPNGTNITDETEYQTEDGTRCFVADGDSGNYTVYRLKAPVVADPIHPECEVNPSFPETADSVVKVYDLQNKKIHYYSTMGEGGGFHLMSLRDKTDIYILDDYNGTTYYANVGTVRGEHSVDLQQHTITMKSNFLDLQAKKSATSNTSATITFKNGTIDISNNDLLSLSSIAGYSGRQFTIIFENITFKITSGHLVKDNGTAPSAVTTNVEFKNCVVEVASSAVLFQLGVAENSTIHAKFVGGKIVYNGTTVPTAYTNTNSLTNQTVEFAQDEEGNFPTICANATIDVTSLAYPTAKGNTYLRKTAESDGVATYTLSSYGFISTYLNLASDLNMVYRVFLPINSEATVTFLIDSFEKTVAFEGLDENGLYLFKLAGITPAKMNENITATLTVNGETVGTLNYTIKAYLDAVKTQNTSEKTLALVDALLVYGAAAQQYDKGNMEGFDTATVEALATLGAIDKASISYEKTGTGIEHFAMNLGGTFFLRAGIVVDDATGMTLEVGDKTYNVANYAPDANGIRAIVCDSFTATELDQPVTFTLKQNGEVIGALTVNANAYLYRASIGTNETLATLAKAIYAYGVAAKAYVTP